MTMARIDEFEKELDELLEKYNDLSYNDLADSLEYYSSEYSMKAERENANA